MNKKLLIGILAGLGIVMTIFNPPLMGILAIAFWIYLGVIVKKRKFIFQEKLESEVVKKHLEWMKAILILSVLSFLISISGIIMHNAQSGLSENDESLSFIIGLIALYIFILSTAGALVIFLKGQQKSF